MNTRADEKKTEVILFIALYPIVVWAALKVAPFLFLGLPILLENMGKVTEGGITWCNESLRSILFFTFLYAFGITVYLSTKRNYRKLEEHGSAKWGNVHALSEKYRAKVYSDNKLFTKNTKMSYDTRKHFRNMNTLIVGGSGSGKTRYYAKPNLMQANTSYIVLDPKGELVKSTGNLLMEKGYDIKVIDLLNMEKSHCYNPFHYISEDNDILRIVTNLIKNTTPKNSANTDPFWEKSEIALLEALMFFLYYEAPTYEQNFGMVMDMIASTEVREEDATFESALDVLFERLRLKEPENIAVRQYDVFKQAAGKTAKSILVSLAVRLEKFNLNSLRGITNTDEMELERIGKEKTVIFCVIPDNDSSFNFIVGMLYTQLFQILYKEADKQKDGRLPVHVHFLMDEFSNVALPSEFDKILSTMRSREISVSIIIQNMAQLKYLFEKQWESIVGNCDELLYLGGNEQSSHEYISKLLGKETIDTNTYGETKGRNGSYSKNYQITGRELLTPDEVRMLNNEYALLFIRGERPVMDLKYDLKQHPNIAETADGKGDIFVYGKTDNELDFSTLTLVEGAEYELLTEEELEQKLKEKK